MDAGSDHPLIYVYEHAKQGLFTASCSLDDAGAPRGRIINNKYACSIRRDAQVSGIRMKYTEAGTTMRGAAPQRHVGYV